MKKAFLTIALSLLCAGAFAQSAAEAFYPGWFFGIKGGVAETAGEASFGKLISPNAAINVGYQFTPAFSLRGELGGWQAKGALAGLDPYKFNYANLDLDAMFDICNIFNYKATRLFNPYIFAGIGGDVRFNNDEANALKASFPTNNYLWEKSWLDFTGRLGLGCDIRLSDGIAISLEVADNLLTDKFNSKVGNFKPELDYQLTGLVGLKFTLDQAKKRAAAVAAETAAAEAAAKAAADKLAAEKAAKEAAEKAAAEKAAREKAEAERLAAEKAAAARAAARATNQNVYFLIDKSNIRDCEQYKVDELVKILNDYPEAVVSITGYADVETGSHKHNMILSQKRAETVTKALVDAGIAENRITTNYVGDTERVSDVQEENRVAVCITK